MQKETKKEKPYKRGDALTKQQEIFCEEVAKGNTQTEAYLVAYPTSQNWQRKSIWCEASKLMDKEKIQNRVEELKEDTKKEVNWTRKRVLANINYILNENKQSIERTKRIYQDEIDEKYEELMQWVNLLNVENINTKGVNKNITKITKEIRQLELQKNVDTKHTMGIQSALQIINRMQRI